MKRLLCVAVLVCPCLLAAGCDSRGGESGRHYERSGGFSYVPPSGWKVTDFGGLKYKVVLGQPKNGFAPNLNCMEEAGGPVETCVDGTIATLTNAIPGWQLVRREKFVTDSGIQGAKIVSEMQQQGKRLRQSAYFLPGNGKTLVVTASALAQGGEEFDSVFDACLKSFRFGN
jgi:hypothetical protein